MPNAPQPLIPIKKSDGSIVKMTLDEFRAYKAQKTSAPAGVDPHSVEGTPVLPNEVVTTNIPPVAKLPPEIVHNLPMVEESQALTSATPTIVGAVVENNKEDIAEEKKLEPVTRAVPPSLPKVEFSSPLEEMPEEESVASHSPVSDINETITNEIISPIAFLVEESVAPKLHALVLSRVKDIRTDAQVKEMAMLPVSSGGLALDESKVTILLNAIQEGLKKKPMVATMPSAQARLKPVVPPMGVINKAALKPIDSLVHPPAKTNKPDAQKILSSLIAEDRVQAQMMSQVQNGGGKIQMHDVVAKPQSVGPVDEMMNFSLIDFRRLAGQSTASADALIQKFNLLKTDSYLLFLSGRAAWLKSPLYHMYLEVLEKSLAMNKTLAVLVGTDPNSLKMEEVQEVARVSQSLNF